jgi:hypothetical protein
MFELAGGLDPTMTTAAAGWFKVGPYTDDNKNVFFHPDKVGSLKYFTPPPQHYKYQDGTDAGKKEATGTPGNPPSTLATGNLGIKSVVDADGMPIIGWMADPSAIGPISAITDLASAAPTATSNSRFYVNSNYAMLYATRLGKKGVNQQTESLISVVDPLAARTSLAAILGSPGSPKDVTRPTDQILPTAARGTFVLHAAGKNGIFVGKGEPGGAQAVGGTIHYGLNFKTMSGTPLTDSNNKPTSSDITKDFDDIFVAGGG